MRSYLLFVFLLLTQHIFSQDTLTRKDFLTGEKYLGFKMYRSGKTMFGWVRIESIGYNGVIIKDFAINKTNNNFILAGNY